MKPDTLALQQSGGQSLDAGPQSAKVQVTLLDHDDLPVARGTAMLPILPGSGFFWPGSPMPGADMLQNAKCFKLPSGETMKLAKLALMAGNPPQYEFRAGPM